MTMPYYVAPEQAMKDKADFFARKASPGVAAPSCSPPSTRQHGL